jgi:hypothetical protein
VRIQALAIGDLYSSVRGISILHFIGRMGKCCWWFLVLLSSWRRGSSLVAVTAQKTCSQGRSSLAAVSVCTVARKRSDATQGLPTTRVAPVCLDQRETPLQARPGKRERTLQAPLLDTLPFSPRKVFVRFSVIWRQHVRVSRSRKCHRKGTDAIRSKEIEPIRN